MGAQGYKRTDCGFSLVEILLVIAVIGILSAVLLPQVLNVRSAAQITTARQQQAELQTALGNWIVAKSSGPGGLAAARAAYTGTKLSLLQGYLQQGTYSELTGDGDNVRSAALDGAKAYLRFSSWSAGQQPIVEWVNQ